jgi:class 3 adenylate cyclase
MTTRRLAAILAADVVGFSSMMERNEEGTLAPSSNGVAAVHDCIGCP